MAMSKARVKVRAWLRGEHIGGVYTGKIVTLIGDVRVARVTLCNESQRSRNLQQSFVVAVPGDRVLHIEVDRQIESNNQRVKHLELFRFANGTLSNNHEVDNHEVEVNITWIDEQEENIEGNNDRGEEEFVSLVQPRRPVEIKMVSGHLTVVYTIGDEISFTELIMALRRLLADHRDREDIMDGHDFLNLSSTREHPLLSKTSSDAPARWIHIKLQVVEGEETLSTTLLMRDDDLYVHGFMNQQGVTYELLENATAANMLPQEYNPQRLVMGLSYRSLLGAQNGHGVITRLTGVNLGRGFAVEAVRLLSSHPLQEPGVHRSVGEALAGLIVLICESARINPVHDSFAAGGWSHGTGFTEQLMRRYVWNWGSMSYNLRSWKRRNYNNPQSIFVSQNCVLSAAEVVQATYLVRNDRRLPRQGAGGPAATKTSKPSSGDDSGDQSQKDSGPSPRPGGSNSPPGGQGDDPMAPRRSQDKDPGKSPVDADEVQRHGRPLVELLALAMHPDFLVVEGMKIVVFDGKRGQIIYRKEEPRQQEQKRQQEGQQEDEGRCQEGQGMVDLVLTGPYRGISAEYGCFAIKIDSPKRTTSTSSGSDEQPPIKWEWDCEDPNHAAQVDTMEPAHGIISSPDGRKVAEVTYAVMSDAREATVQVGLQIKSGLSPVGASGKVTALIDGFDVPSVLFSCTEEMGGQCLSASADGGSWSLLQLARNVVAVPCCRVLHIDVNLQIKTDDGMGIGLKTRLSFDNNGIRSSKTDDGNEVEVEVAWYPEIAWQSHQPDEITIGESAPSEQSGVWEPEQIDIKEAGEQEFTNAPSEQSGSSEVKTVSVSEEYATEVVVYTIGEELSFRSFIKVLRRVAANHRDREDILDRHPDSNISSTREHPLLPEERAGQPARWLHVKMQAVEGNETSWTTLAIRGDNLYVHGFMNQQGVWYGLVGQPTGTSASMLPSEYKPEHLHWGGIWYSRLLGGRQVVAKLEGAHMGRDFAMRAVRRLSSSIHPDDEVDGLMSARLALAGLMFMVCESARMNPILESFAGGWSTGTGFTKELITDYVWKYAVMSWRLLEWKRRNYAEPIPYSELHAIWLVYNR